MVEACSVLSLLPTVFLKRRGLGLFIICIETKIAVIITSFILGTYELYKSEETEQYPDVVRKC